MKYILIVTALLTACVQTQAQSTFTDEDLDWISKFGSATRCIGIMQDDGERRAAAKFNRRAELIYDTYLAPVADRVGMDVMAERAKTWGEVIDKTMDYNAQANFCYNQAVDAGWI